MLSVIYKEYQAYKNALLSLSQICIFKQIGIELMDSSTDFFFLNTNFHVFCRILSVCKQK